MLAQGESPVGIGGSSPRCFCLLNMALRDFESSLRALRDGPEVGSHAFLTAWGALPKLLQVRLCRNGFTDPGTLSTLTDLSAEDRQETFREITGLGQGLTTADEQALWTLMQAATEAAQCQRRKIARMSSATVWMTAGARPAPTDTLRSRPPTPAETAATWPVPRKTRPSPTGTQTRAQAEQTERERWAKRLAAIIMDAELPAARAAEKAKSPETVLLACARGRRANTLRARVLEWEKAARWPKAAHGTAYPVELVQVLDFVSDRASEPCGRTCLTSFLTTLAFLEEVGGVPEQRRLSQDSLLKGLVEELTCQLSAGAPATKKAPRHLTLTLAALELAVGDCSYPPFKRGVAWFKLVRHWASLRWDDTKGITSEAMTMSSRPRAACDPHEDHRATQAGSPPGGVRFGGGLSGQSNLADGRVATLAGPQLPKGLLPAHAIPGLPRSSPGSREVCGQCGL